MTLRRVHLPPRKPASWAAIVALALGAICLAAVLYLLIGLVHDQNVQRQNSRRLVQIRNEQITEIHRQLCAAIAAIPAENPAGLQRFERQIGCPVTTPVPVPAPTLSPTPHSG